MKWRPHLVTSQCRNGSPPNSIKGRHNQHNYHICIHKRLAPSQVQMPKFAVSGVVGLKAFYATVELCTSLDDHSTCIASTKEMKRWIYRMLHFDKVNAVFASFSKSINWGGKDELLTQEMKVWYQQRAFFSLGWMCQSKLQPKHHRSFPLLHKQMVQLGLI